MEAVFKKGIESPDGLWPIIYLADLPHHLAHKGVPSDVARIGMFKLDHREGNLLVFKGDIRYKNTFHAKALKQPATGDEVCFIQYHGSRLMLDAKRSMRGGRIISTEELKKSTLRDGRNLEQYLNDEKRKLDEK